MRDSRRESGLEPSDDGSDANRQSFNRRSPHTGGEQGKETRTREGDPGEGKQPHGKGARTHADHHSPINLRSDGVEEGSNHDGNAPEREQSRETGENEWGAEDSGWSKRVCSRLKDGADRRIIGRETRRIILQHHPDFESDGRLRRWIRAMLFSPWHDDDTGLRLIPWQLLQWICGSSFKRTEWTGGDTLRYLRDETSLQGLDWNEWIAEERCRTVVEDGIHPAVCRAIDEDLSKPADETPSRVYLDTGEAIHDCHPERERDKWKDRLSEEPERAPSSTSRRVLEHMNGRHPNTLKKVTRHTDEALAYVDDREYDVDLTRDIAGETRTQFKRRKKRIQDSLRRYHRSALRAIQHQYKPFYRFSPNGFTDRIFPANDCVLSLPSDVRAILCQDYHNVDLASAHLMIAAWLWDAELAKDRLRDPEYSVWTDLMEHFAPIIERATGEPEPSDSLFDAIKGKLKPALYQAVYVMPEPNLKGKLTSGMKDLLHKQFGSAGRKAGVDAGTLFGEHDMMRSLLDARDEQMHKVVANGGMKAADGRFIDLEPRTEIARSEGRPNPKLSGAAKVLGTVAQSYEMELMSVLVDYEHELQGTSKRFRIAFWLHDGAYVQVPRYLNARMSDLNERLSRKADELGVLARFDHEPIQPPTAQ